jgi:DinB family protein
MNAECLRIADQLRRAFAGDAWHGPPLRDLLTGITAEQACKYPLPSAHSIWELVLHIDAYLTPAWEVIRGIPLPKIVGTPMDWPSAADRSAAGWSSAVDRLFHDGELLAQAIEGQTDARLQETVPGRGYTFYYLFHGIVQHSLYHGGQIAMLKRAVTSSPPHLR